MLVEVAAQVTDVPSARSSRKPRQSAAAFPASFVQDAGAEKA